MLKTLDVELLSDGTEITTLTYVYQPEFVEQKLIGIKWDYDIDFYSITHLREETVVEISYTILSGD